MVSAASRYCRMSGPGPILLMVQVVALLALGLAAGFFHYRVGLLLEPVDDACGGPDPMARMQVAEQLMARSLALAPWQPLQWIPMAGLVLALLGAISISVYRLGRLSDRLRWANWAVMALHGVILMLAVRALHLYDMAWISVAKLAPTTCLVELGEQGRLPLAQAQEVVFGILTRQHALLLRNPDDLALVLAALLLMAMVAGFMLWRAIVRARSSEALEDG
ncbi:TPA: hypothetical protein UOA91_003642 [Stenotrophomonas maltophilia]|nr:hypothetical protein [Stenotrophomonas maltophilia]HEL3781715.1 hypothetical protein [Stenotrophomonas maltophilia]HEL5007388.1 hypothetical protein [Stenotrophomonas maltophilia]